MGDEDSRFKNLIQPIKDLASNWDIDIAESLTEYLDELEGLRVSLDGGVNSLNFAEAALLIQGSTAIYSKKVEYLHQLVLQSLEYIANKKSNVAVNAKSKAITQTTFNDESILFGNDPDLLLLDDDVEVGTNINLKTLSGQAARDRKSRNSSGRFSTNSGLDASRISISLMHSVLQDDHGSSNLKLSSCVMDTNGALLIGGIQSSSSAANSQSLLSQSSLFHHTTTGKAQDRSVGFMMQDYQEDNNDVYDDHGGADDMYGGGDDDNGYWDDAPAAAAPSSSSGAAITAAQEDKKVVLMMPSATVRSAAGGVVPFSRPSALFSRHQWLSETQPTSAPPPTDQMLDPHQLVPGSKAIGRGKTHRLPAALTARKAGNEEAEVEAQLSISEFLPKEGTQTLSELQQKMRAMSGTTIKGDGRLQQQGLFNPHLLPLLKSIRKAARREKVAQNRAKGGSKSTKTGSTVVDYAAYERLWSRDLDLGGLAPFAEQGEDAEVVDLAGRLQLAAGVPEHEVLGLAAPSASAAGEGAANDAYDEDGGNDYYYDNNDDNGYDAGAGTEGVFSRAVEEESEEAELARRLERVLNEDLVHSVNSYQAICERHIKNFHSGAERYAKETQLSRRVSDWTKRLEPILRAQEDAPQFDIHEYSDRILVDIGVVNQQTAEESGNEKGPAAAHEWITFDDIARGKDATEVCRMFLACLQLANLGNIEFEELLPSKNVSAAGDAKKKSAGGKKADASQSSTRKRSESRDVLGVESLFHLRLVKENRHKHLEHFNRVVN